MTFTRTLITAALALTPMITANPLPDPSGVVARGDRNCTTEGGSVDRFGLPSNTITCPGSDNGGERTQTYPEHAYTLGQVKAAMDQAARFQESRGRGRGGKPAQTDDDYYPHILDPGEEKNLPFRCGGGDGQAEFPIKTDGTLFELPANDTQSIPDRVVYEFTWNNKKGEKDKLTTKLCGVMRRGPNNDFIKCT